MLRLAFDFIITWRETRTKPNAYALIRKNRHWLNQITQVSEVNLHRLNQYLHPYTFLQLTLLTPFAGCQVLVRK